MFETNENERYLRITNFDVVLTMDDMKVFATGIFPETELSTLNSIYNMFNKYVNHLILI